MRSSKTDKNPFETQKENAPTRNGLGSADRREELLKDIQNHVMSVAQ